MAQLQPAIDEPDLPMATRVAQYDWAGTSLGPASQWPEVLKSAVAFVLECGFPAALVWGRELTTLYNDGFCDILGRKDCPLGRSFAELWEEIWSELDPLITQVWAGQSVFQENRPLLIHRDGQPVQAYFTFTYSPLRDGQGRVIGFIDLVMETTEAVNASMRLRESEARARRLVDGMAQANWETDADGMIVTDSPSWRAYTGQSLQEWLGAGWLDAIHPDDQAYAEASWLDAVAHPRQVDAEFRLRSVQGGWRWTNVRAVPLLDEHGEVIKWVGMNIDIGARKDAELALRQSEARYRTLFEEVQEGFCIIERCSAPGEPIDFRWVEGNPAFSAIAGRDDLMGQTLRQTFPEETERAIDIYERVLLTGEPAEFEYAMPSLDLILELHVFRPSSQEAGRVAVLFQDITLRKRTELALAEAEQRQRALLEGIPQLVWRASGQGQWTWASPQWTGYTGQSEAESLGEGWVETVHPDDRHAVRAAWAAAQDTGGFEVDYRVRGALGHRYRWFHTRATPVLDLNGAIVEWLGTSTDVDEMRTMQERQHVLVAELQHRTRNLMGVINAVVEKTGRASKDMADFHVRLRDRLQALGRVQSLLSRLDEHDRVTFDELIHTELSAMNGGLERISLHGPAGVRLRSSTVQTLAMAIHELATNAVKYGALGQPQASLTIQWQLLPGAEGEAPNLSIDWRESGVQMPRGERQGRSGQGRELIERALPYQLSAQTTYELGADGVHCTILLPVSARGPASSA